MAGMVWVALEFEPGETVLGEGGDDQRDQRGGDPDEVAIEEIREHFLAEKTPVCVEGECLGEYLRRDLENLGVCPKRHQDHPDHGKSDGGADHRQKQIKQDRTEYGSCLIVHV